MGLSAPQLSPLLKPDVDAQVSSCTPVAQLSFPILSEAASSKARAHPCFDVDSDGKPL